jgi:hypothetical protein
LGERPTSPKEDHSKDVITQRLDCQQFMYGSVQFRPRELDHPTTLGIGGIGCAMHTHVNAVCTLGNMCNQELPLPRCSPARRRDCKFCVLFNQICGVFCFCLCYSAHTRPHNPFVIRAIIDEYLLAYVLVYCLLELNMLCDCGTQGCGDHSPLTTYVLVWSLPCLRHILSQDAVAATARRRRREFH